ncbi:MAG TPA: type II toxin-antitoxin system death-on-curing family toxin [Bryobacteraceae bacterium]|nr:type II toxin-antitoxin system death-on-curing family toxin [Bryobacteraceae bacterium]
MTFYPTVDDAVVIHGKLVAKFGGSLGIRDRGSLESALARPQSGYYTDLIQEAAALWESLSQNHPFIDGNKRVAITLTAAFLRTNGYRLEFRDLDAYRFLIGLYESGCMRFAELEAWLRLHVVPDDTHTRH